MDRFGRRSARDEIGASVYELPPGQALCPYHWETDEEWMIVLEGAVSVRHPEGTDVLGPGDATAFPIGPEGAHKVFNASERDRPLHHALDQGATRPTRSIPTRTRSGSTRAGREEHTLVRLGENLDYYDGETP